MMRDGEMWSRVSLSCSQVVSGMPAGMALFLGPIPMAMQSEKEGQG